MFRELVLCGREVWMQRAALLGLREVLKVAVFGEDIGKRLLHDIIGTCMDESVVLVGQYRGRISQSNRSADVSGLGDFK
jgi:hypothetical protein